MEIAKLVADYLKILLSVQVILGAAVVVFFCMFKADIRALLKRTARISLAGVGEFSVSQIEKTNEEFPTYGKQPPSINPDDSGLPENLTLTPDEVKKVEEFFAAERAKAALWEYRYLNYFLARSTQHVLDWLATLSVRTTISLFDSLWLPTIPNAEERRAIVNALQAHYLIVLTGEMIEVTPKGKEYLGWRGPLPD